MPTIERLSHYLIIHVWDLLYDIFKDILDDPV